MDDAAGVNVQKTHLYIVCAPQGAAVNARFTVADVVSNALSPIAAGVAVAHLVPPHVAEAIRESGAYA